MSTTERTLNTEVTTVLAVVQRDADGVETAIDADETPTAEIRRLGVLVEEIAAASVSHDGTGEYSFTWTPSSTGIHVITWAFEVGGEEYESEEKVDVVADVEGTSSSAEAEDDAAAVPDLGTSRTCLVTEQFYDAGGNALQGVYVRFTPDRETTAFLSSGVVANDVTASSDEDGVLELYLVRGVTGTISLTGLGITRQVTVPDVATTTIKALVELGDDPLEVQRPQFKSLPRRA